MSVSEGYREFVLDRLGEVQPVTWRRMFGEVGVYTHGVFFAIIADDTLYFKVDAQTQAQFEAAGMSAFNPMGQPMRYYSVPLNVLEDEDELATWMRQALEVAERAAEARPPKRRSAPRNSQPEPTA